MGFYILYSLFPLIFKTHKIAITTLKRWGPWARSPRSPAVIWARFLLEIFLSITLIIFYRLHAINSQGGKEVCNSLYLYSIRKTNFAFGATFYLDAISQGLSFHILLIYRERKYRFYLKREILNIRFLKQLAESLIINVKISSFVLQFEHLFRLMRFCRIFFQKSRTL